MICICTAPWHVSHLEEEEGGWVCRGGVGGSVAVKEEESIGGVGRVGRGGCEGGHFWNLHM